MDASIHPIPLPSTPEDSLTWDKSIAEISVVRSPRLTRHGIAHGRSVVGTNTDGTTRWNSSFDSRVISLASNRDGSVLASSTASHVSLLRGSDGSILASRHLPSPPKLTFVCHSKCNDVLAVVCSPDVVLISNIDGMALNSQPKEAVQRINIDSMRLDPPRNVRRLVGAYVGEDTVRFFVEDFSHTVLVHDYHLGETRSVMVCENIMDLVESGWSFDSMDLDDTSDNVYFLLVSEKEGCKKMSWLNVADLKLVAQYTLGTNVVSFKPVRGAENCLAAAFVTKEARIQVVQAAIGRDCAVILFHVQIDVEVEAVELASSAREIEYSFRFSTVFAGDAVVVAEFADNDVVRAGTVHSMFAHQRFDEAYRCIGRELNCGDRVSVSIHKSTVALWQFRHVLSRFRISSNGSVIEAKECLRRLASGAVSGGEVGIDCMVDSAKFLLGWPRNQTSIDSSGDCVNVSLKEVCTALSAMSHAITSVTRVLNSSRGTELEEMKRKLDDRHTALKGLRHIADVDGLQLTPSDPYLSIGSLADLMNSLVSQAAFKSVERLLKSDSGKNISQDVIASSVLHIPPCVNPRIFLPWLCDVVIPTLSVGHPLLESIRAWSCGAADRYDEDVASCGLDYSITLLQAVSMATARLTVAMNKSFAHKFQLNAETNDDYLDESLQRDGSFFSSFDSKSSLRKMHTRPTVLNVGMISGTKSKDIRVFSAQRVARPTTSTESLDSTLCYSSPSMNSPIVVDEEGLGYDCVEDKLVEAVRLKAARSLGMTRDCLKLADYTNMGEQYILKELVKVGLKHSVAGKGDIEKRVDCIRSYAVEVKADFNDAVHQHAIHLCDSNRDDIPSILQHTEVLSRWCNSPPIQCLIVLRMLRKALVSVQRPPDLSGLAYQAMKLANDKMVKSELEEAWRLLSIDSLIRKYCGNGAQQYFRVDEASHGIRLVKHVCRYIDVDGVLDDVMALCDAFNSSVSRLDTFVSLVHRVMLEPPRTGCGQELNRSEHVASILQYLYTRESSLAERVGERIIALCAEILEDCQRSIVNDVFSVKAKRQSLVATSTACAILSVMEDRNCYGKKAKVEVPKLLKEFQRLSKLQNGCNIFLTLEELRNPASRSNIVFNLLKPCIDLLQQRSFNFEDGSLRQKLQPIMASAKHWCSILCDSPSQVSQLWANSVGIAASHVAGSTENHASVLLLEISGVLDERSGQSSFHSAISVALSLCGRAFAESSKLSNLTSLLSKDSGDLDAALIAMKSMAQASMLLREHIIMYSPPSMLSLSISLANLAEFTCVVSCRSDLSVGEKLETYIKLLHIGSHKHLQHHNVQKQSQSKNMQSLRNGLPPTPTLHPTWYVGDGLLLRPLDALFIGMASCEMILNFESDSSHGTVRVTDSHKTSDIMHLLESRGAHSTCLRLIAFSLSVALSQSNSRAGFSLPFSRSSMNKVCSALAERSLGGMESGLTSGSIDTSLAISYLIGDLPKEVAFKIYQAALPSAIGKRDFARIRTLAGIGAYCGVGKFSSGEHFPWNKQVKFINQCYGFASNADLWSVLSRYKVSFDPAVFTQSDDSSTSLIQGYCETLIWNAAKHLNPKSTLQLASKFTEIFNISKCLPPSVMIEFLLSIPDHVEMNKTDCNTNCDIRWDIFRIEEAVRDCLPILPILNQSKVLRKCIMALERDVRVCHDYDRHAMVITLYGECLVKLEAFMNTETRQQAHAEECKRIERRRNALILLFSIFEKYPTDEKPNYMGLFERLPGDPSILTSPNQRRWSVLGSDSTPTVFDPLNSLHDVLLADSTNSMAASLSPLCSWLGLPSGYIHARSLIVHYRQMKLAGDALPPVDSAILPVIKKLVSAHDRAELVWWCSLQYNNGSVEQLKCLDLAYEYATMASEKMELSHDGEEESCAIERVKRIDLARAILSDQILVNEVLTNNQSTSAKVKALYTKMIHKVQGMSRNNDNYMPEVLVKEFLVHGSMMAAVASLDENDGFATCHFRSLAILVHDACKLLSTRYSHINIGKCSRALTRRWMIHGDEVSSDSAAYGEEDSANYHGPLHEEHEIVQAANNKDIKDGSDEITNEFIMDIGSMNISSGDHVWSNSNNISTQCERNGIRSSEEPSAFDFLSSQREVSDHQFSRVALRIAFLMCFAQDYHQRADDASSDDENSDANISKKMGTKRDMIKSNSNLQKHRQKSIFLEGDLALAHARELLGIVFAKQGCSSSAFLLDDSLEDSILLTGLSNTFVKDKVGKQHKALSFAMRHRALRVASILCPHNILIRVILEEGYSREFDDDHLDTLAFGSFVAMEVEAMGLSLPHSDLVQLSTMHFPSYARTLWRNHRAAAVSGGRLQLLLLELSISHHKTVDWDLMILMFVELTKRELPRSLLLACECAVQSNAIDIAASLGRADVIQCVADALKNTTRLISQEIQANVATEILNEAQCFSTIYSLVSVINVVSVHIDPIYFIEALTALAGHRMVKEKAELRQGLLAAVVRITNHLVEPVAFSKARSIIRIVDPFILPHIISPPSVISSSSSEKAIETYENSFCPEDKIE